MTKSKILFRSALLAILALSSCTRNKLQITNFEVQKPGSNDQINSIQVGEHILISCRVSGMKLTKNNRPDLQADVLLLKEDKTKPDGWAIVWSAYTLYQNDAPLPQGTPALRIDGDVIPSVEPGAYKLRFVVRDQIAMTKRQVDKNIRLERTVVTPPPSFANYPETTAAEAAANPGTTFDKAVALYRSGDLNNALELFQLIAVTEPSYPELNHNIGLILLKQGHTSAGVDFFNRELNRDPNHYGALTRLGDIRLQTGDQAGALAYYQKAANAHPHVVYPSFKIGEINLQQKKYDDAIRAFNAALQADPNDQWSQINIGTAYYRKGDNGAALKIFELLAGKPSAQPVVHLNFSLALYKSGDYARAKAEATKARDMGAPVDPAFLAILEKATT